jgi:hypothetical protein
MDRGLIDAFEIKFKSAFRNLKFTILLGAMLFALSFPTQAQQTGKIHRIGFLSGGFPGPSHWTARLRAELQKISFVVGENIVFVARFT